MTTPTESAVLALECSLRRLVEHMDDEERLFVMRTCLRLRRAAGMPPRLVAVAGRVQWHREHGTFDGPEVA